MAYSVTQRQRVLSIMLGQFLSKLLFGVTPFDVPTLVMVTTVLGEAFYLIGVDRRAGTAECPFTIRTHSG